MAKNDYLYYTNEGAFKSRLRKLYKLAIREGVRLKIDLNDFIFMSCEGFNDIIDVNYTNHKKDFSLSVRGSEKLGYKILSVSLDDSLLDEEFEEYCDTDYCKLID